MRSSLLFVGLVTMLSACSSAATTSSSQDGGSSSSSSSGDSNSSAETPVEKCGAVASAYCERAKTCQVTSDIAGCTAEVEDGIHCSAATGVTSTYDACLHDLANADCKATTLPSRCQGVVITQTTGSSDAGAATVAPPPSSGGTSGAAKPNTIWGRPSGTGEFNVYLGCFCASSDPDSVLNTVGAYGPNSKFSMNSIWNQYGTYGGDYSNQSACNKYGSDAPIVVNNGVVVGRLTVNQFAAGAITDANVQAFLANEACAR